MSWRLHVAALRLRKNPDQVDRVPKSWERLRVGESKRIPRSAQVRTCAESRNKIGLAAGRADHMVSLNKPVKAETARPAHANASTVVAPAGLSLLSDNAERALLRVLFKLTGAMMRTGKENVNKKDRTIGKDFPDRPAP